MEWTDEGIVLGVRRHGESSAIVELLDARPWPPPWPGCAAVPVRGCARCCSPATAYVRCGGAADEHLGYYAIEGTRRARHVLASSHAVLA